MCWSKNLKEIKWANNPVQKLVVCGRNGGRFAHHFRALWTRRTFGVSPKRGQLCEGNQENVRIKERNSSLSKTKYLFLVFSCPLVIFLDIFFICFQRPFSVRFKSRRCLLLTLGRRSTAGPTTKKHRSFFQSRTAK